MDAHGSLRRSGWQRMTELVDSAKWLKGESGVERLKRGEEIETSFQLNNCFTLVCTKTQRWHDFPVVFC